MAGGHREIVKVIGPTALARRFDLDPSTTFAWGARRSGIPRRYRPGVIRMLKKLGRGDLVPDDFLYCPTCGRR